LIVHYCAFAGDGGTICIIATDDAGQEVSIRLTSPLAGLLAAGRLYFNGLVPMRSEREAQVLKLLSEATVKASNPRSCRETIRMIIVSVKSEEYLRFITGDERDAAKALAEEAERDVWEQPSGKKKRRTWRRNR
jgi:hypothetical protein